jgi:hypothetical protein
MSQHDDDDDDDDVNKEEAVFHDAPEHQHFGKHHPSQTRRKRATTAAIMHPLLSCICDHASLHTKENWVSPNES